MDSVVGSQQPPEDGRPSYVAANRPPLGHGLILGLEWWGVGPIAMADAAGRAGISVDPVVLWDIRKRLHRIALKPPFKTPIGSYRAQRRISRIVRNVGTRIEWVVVTAPHRVAPQVLEHLRRNSNRLVALLSDRPVGPRSLKARDVRIYDAFGTPDPSWLADLPCEPNKVIPSPWGSVLKVDPQDAEPYAPEGIAVVGTPYPDRVRLVKNIEGSGLPVYAFGSQWAGQISGTVYDSMTIADTIQALRSRRLAVLNIHHEQFNKGLNPQFADYAINNVPQVILSGQGDEIGRTLGYETHPEIADLLFRDVSLNQLDDTGRTAAIGEFARARLTFETSLGQLIA